MITKNEYRKIKNWMYRNARPLDLARWQYHFENGSKESVLNALSAYQNEDGGFGHALEADSWNPNSSPMQTWTATEILHEIDAIDKNSDIVKSILQYLGSGKDFDGKRWTCSIKSNDEYPHAPWWTYATDEGYNPTACLAGFALYCSDKNSPLYERALNISKQSIEKYLMIAPLNDMHEISCYIRLTEYINTAKLNDIIDTSEVKKQLKDNVKYLIDNDKNKWESGYVCRPSHFFITSNSMFYSDNHEAVSKELDFIVQTRNSEGIWDIAWKWGAYEKEFAISKNWWKSYGIIANMRLLKEFEFFPIKEIIKAN